MSWASKLSAPYRIDHGKDFRLKDFDPASTGHFRSKEQAQGLLEQGISEMREQQISSRPAQLGGADHLAGDGCGRKRRAHQARNGGSESAGMPGHAFEQPSEEELNHNDFGRRLRLSRAGQMAFQPFLITKRWLVVRVHP